ncbi:MAG TPA: hypothetical protein VKU00_11665 [Chthonomonadaceae bacterium]|nr:hypothetical protein [Chthonomonadaceae bacterium]
MRTPSKLLALACLVLAAACSAGPQTGNPPLLPDPKLTPGDTLAVTKADICVSGYSGKVRDVPQAVKEQAYKEYGITHHEPGEYEVDHLISLELGGSNSIKNLWPQSYKTQPWNAHVKDKLENRLHSDVCSGKIDLKTAQRDIAKDWIAAYKKYFQVQTPGASGEAGNGHGKSDRSHPAEAGGGSGARSAAPGGTSGAAGKVWVNLDSGVYWKPGSQYYGKTKHGKYLTEQEAIQAGYHAAKGQ